MYLEKAYSVKIKEDGTKSFPFNSYVNGRHFKKYKKCPQAVDVIEDWNSEIDKKRKELEEENKDDNNKK